MTTPRIEEIKLKSREDMIDIVTTDSRHLEILDKALTKAHQAWIDEAVETVREIRNQIPYGYKMTETCADEKVGAYIQALDDIIKALQDNK